MLFFRLLFLILLAIWPFATLNASALETTPIRITLSSQKTNDVLWLKNHGSESVLVELKTVKWTQKNEQDIYEETSEIIQNPPVVTITANDKQIIRVGLRPKADTDFSIEQCYRLFIKEIPVNNLAYQGIQTLLEISLPVFIAPKEKKQKLLWQISRQNNKTLLRVINEGNVHAQLSDIKIYPSENAEAIVLDKPFFYLLAGESKHFEISNLATALNSPVKINAKADWGDIATDAQII